MKKVLMMPSDYLKQNSVLDINIDEKIIARTMLDIQDIDIEPLLGTELYNYMINKIYDRVLLAPYTTLLYEYIYPVMICCMEINIIDNLIYKYTNSSVTSNSTANVTALGLKDISQLKIDKESKNQFYKDRLIKHLTFNSQKLYPEYYKSTIEGILPDTNSGSMFFYYDDDIVNLI